MLRGATHAFMHGWQYRTRFEWAMRECECSPRRKLANLSQKLTVPASDNLIRVARALAEVREQRFVFAGASVLPLLLNDPAAPAARFTGDVDAVVDVITYDQWERLQSRLRECGVVVRADPVVGKGRMCLFHLNEIEVDIMPVRISLLMHPSRMLEIGFQFAEPHQLADDLEILALSASGMLAAKLEAFGDRGVREFPVSKDLEDIVALLDRRIGIADELSEAPAEMRHFIATATTRLLGDGHVLDVVSDLLRDRERQRRVIEIMRTLT
jgi:predicted nucleotidyltransferase